MYPKLNHICNYCSNCSNAIILTFEVNIIQLNVIILVRNMACKVCVYTQTSIVIAFRSTSIVYIRKVDNHIVKYWQYISLYCFCQGKYYLTKYHKRNCPFRSFWHNQIFVWFSDSRPQLWIACCTVFGSHFKLSTKCILEIYSISLHDIICANHSTQERLAKPTVELRGGYIKISR